MIETRKFHDRQAGCKTMVLNLRLREAGDITVMALDLPHCTLLPLPTPIMFLACLDDAGTRQQLHLKGVKPS
jgi:hypothetical protein